MLSAKGQNPQATLPGRLKTSVVTGDVHDPWIGLLENAGALFQVASAVSIFLGDEPRKMWTPELADFDTGDPTQGPACAIAAGAATIYCNYFVPIEGSQGQTATRQLDGLAGPWRSLSSAMKLPACGIRRMQNGYALGYSKLDLNAITQHLGTLATDQIDTSSRQTSHWNTSRCRSHRSSGAASNARARFLKVDSFVGFRLGRKSDSRCWLGVEASMHGGSLFSGFA